jgi:hypothetical protein
MHFVGRCGGVFPQRIQARPVDWGHRRYRRYRRFRTYGGPGILASGMYAPLVDNAVENDSHTNSNPNPTEVAC